MDIKQAITVAHIAGMIMFMGNLMISSVWKFSADRSKHPTLMCFALRQVAMMDRIFGAAGVSLMLFSGIAIVVMQGMSWASSWMAGGAALFMLACGLWLGVMVPTHGRQEMMSKDIAAGRPIASRYWQLSWVWHGAGVATICVLLLGAYWMMSAPH